MTRSVMFIALLVGGLVGGCTVTARATPVRAESPPPPPPPPPAAAPAQHPAYLHALTDLRAARAFLSRPANVVVKWDEQRAIREIDAAIHEIKEAAIDDGKDLNDHEPIDRATWGDRLARSLELLKKARADIAGEEDSPSGRVHGLRDRAYGHIGNAENLVKEGMADARAMREPPPPPPPPPGPASHPAYLHALTDLRTARALLERPTHNVEVKWEDHRAIGQIDAAIREIRDAAIDDNKPIGDHPPLDARLHHRDRIRAAIEILDKAARDIEQREDNQFARGMRDRAIAHIREAVRIAREAAEDRRR